MAGGGRPQTGQVTGLAPSIQTGCLPVVLSSCSSETLTPCRTRAGAPPANPPRPQAAQQEHLDDCLFRFMKHGGWSPAITGENLTCGCGNVSKLPQIYIFRSERVLQHDRIFVKICCMFFFFLLRFFLLLFNFCV